MSGNVSTNVPGIKTEHCWISDACRRMRGETPALAEALTRLSDAYRETRKAQKAALDDESPRTQEPVFHFVLTVEWKDKEEVT